MKCSQRIFYSTHEIKTHEFLLWYQLLCTAVKKSFKTITDFKDLCIMQGNHFYKGSFYLHTRSIIEPNQHLSDMTGEQHDPQIAQSFTDLESILTQTFQKAWRVVRHTLERSSQENSMRKKTIIHSKDQRKNLTRQSRAYNARNVEEEENTEEETLKILVIFKNHERIHEEELQKAKKLKISRNSCKSVKDCCRGQHRLKIFGNHSNLSKIAAENKKLVKLFQIFERFTNFFFSRRKFLQMQQRSHLMCKEQPLRP
jgi:hypothetical protein